MSGKNLAICPSCNGDVRFKKAPYLGQTVICGKCHTYLQVTSRDPIDLDWVTDLESVDDDSYSPKGKRSKNASKRNKQDFLF